MRTAYLIAFASLLTAVTMPGQAQQGVSAGSAQPSSAQPSSAQPSSAQPSAQPAPPLTATPGSTGGPVMPTDHPSVPESSGHSAMPQTAVRPDATLAASSVTVRIVDPQGQPMSGLDVELLELFSSIAKGDDQKSRRARTNAQGEASFDELEIGSRYSYSVRTNFEGLPYSVPGFRALSKSGLLATIVVFSTTTDPREAMIGMRGFTYVQLREDSYHFDVLYRVFNMSAQAWKPQGVEITLPSRSRSFEAETNNSAGHFEADGQKAKLVGSFLPGQQDVRFTFDVPTRNRSRESFRMTVPPHVAEFRVLVETTPEMSLSAPGFEPVQRTRDPSGTPVLVTRKQAPAGATQLEPMVLDLDGLPMIGPERFYVIGAAGILALLGLGTVVWRRRPEEDEELADYEEARGLLLEELAALEHAKQQDQIGQRTYERARRELIDALARLLVAEPPSES